MVKVAVDHIIPLTEARTRLSELVENTTGDNFWVLTKSGKPRAALIDLDYLNNLVKVAQFNQLAQRSQAAFAKYLDGENSNIETITEAEVAAILQVE